VKQIGEETVEETRDDKRDEMLTGRSRSGE
jgi:hypothetical protein